MTDLINPSELVILEKRIGRNGPVYERDDKTYEDLEAEIARL